ncbi:hypothetical protein B0H17DRAFT_1077609 [Mycena rosella]|uniref:Copper transport protein n=1 Tax=Mycena rosella TaxID=1033263 RepID=A0AAD7D8M8_MYCRO|nr:hypothetical protein B0H17DRAFT_1077609 [Mycena rosella]
MAGACIELFILALVDRWISAVRAMMELHWREAGGRTRRENLKARTQTTRGGSAPYASARRNSSRATLGFTFMLAVIRVSFLPSVRKSSRRRSSSPSHWGWVSARCCLGGTLRAPQRTEEQAYLSALCKTRSINDCQDPKIAAPIPMLLRREFDSGAEVQACSHHLLHFLRDTAS